MLVISLVCNLGMSTSMLIKKMSEYAKQKDIETDIDALPFDRLDGRIEKTDMLLIGPQVRHLYKKLMEQYGDKIPVIQVMNMSDYALLRVDRIFESAYEVYRNKTHNS